MNEQLIVSTEWLAAHLGESSLRVVDIRGHVLPATEPPPHYFNHLAEYQQAHIQGASFIDWVHEITDPADSRHAQIAPPERFAAAMERAGIGDGMQVVVYDDATGMFAARLWWALNYYGHHSVAVLDGGWQKWIAEGRPTEAMLPAHPPAQFTPRPDPAWRRTGDQVRAALGSPSQLMDVRTPQEYRGEASRAKRAGHIPGALNVPRTALVNPDGTLPTVKTLQATLSQHGISPDSPEVVVYCNAGVSASFGLLSLRRAGYTNATLYDGSWKDWGNADDTPIE